MNKYRIDELCNVGSSKRIYKKEYVKEGVPFYRGKEIIMLANNESIDEPLYISEERYQELKDKHDVPKNGDILMISIGATLGVPYFVDLHYPFYFKDGNVTWFSDFSDKLNSKFLYLWLRSDYGNKVLWSTSIGSAQPALTLDALRSIEIKVPRIEIQNRISSVLTAFDDLIENNTRRIAILEEMARLIYREWFAYYRYPGAQGSGEQATPGHENDRMVDSGTELGHVPEGWGVMKLEDVADLNPESISKNYKGKIEYINISGVDTGKINETEFYDIEDAPGRAKRKLNHGDIIWSSVRPNLKSYALIMNPKPNWIASTGFTVIRPVKLPASFLYNFVTTDYFVEYLINHARGSAYPAVNVSDFKNAKIVVPPDDLVKRYDDLVWSNFQQIDRLERKNKKLKETRDMLLPKLISGNIDIN